MSSFNRFIAYITLSLSIALASAGASADQNSVLQEFYNELDSQGISVIVAVSGVDAEVSVREFGVFKDDGIPAASTQVDLLSLTKSVTAVSILRLVEMKKLSLDNTLKDIFFQSSREQV